VTDAFVSPAVTISWGPMTFAAGLLLSFVTWVLYGESRVEVVILGLRSIDPLRSPQKTGQKHYIGPIRSITKWTAGAELDVRQALDQKSKQPSSGNDTGTTGEGSGDSLPRLQETTV